MKFNTFAETIFLRLPRSCRVAEKSDPIDRFSGPDLMQKITKNQWFLSNFSAQRITKYLAVQSQPWRGGKLPSPTSSRLESHFYCFDIGSREQNYAAFQQKTNRCDNTTRRSDGLRRCNRGSMNFNTFAET